MYNVDFEPQCERFRRDLYGNAGAYDPDTTSEQAHKMYFLPKGVKTARCEPDPITGELIPVQTRKSEPEELEKSLTH